MCVLCFVCVVLCVGRGGGQAGVGRAAFPRPGGLLKGDKPAGFRRSVRGPAHLGAIRSLKP